MFTVYEGFHNEGNVIHSSDVQSTECLARYPESKVSPSWSNCSFKTMIEAINYTRKWLGIYNGVMRKNPIKVNQRIVFQGNEIGYCYMVIKKE